MDTLSYTTPVDFPRWKYQFRTEKAIGNKEFRERLRILRGAASNFTRKPAVRECIFREKGKLCYICGAEATQIDHKISVYRFAKERELDFREMNSFGNLFPICAHCNSSKSP